MVAPITNGTIEQFIGPFSTVTRKRTRQKPPFDRPLPYIYEYSFGRVATRGQMTGSPSTFDESKQADFSLTTEPDFARKLASAQNKAYAKLKDAMGDTQGWAENLAQISKTREGIVQRSVQMYNFVKALRRGRFDEAARVLRTPVPSGVSHRKALAQNFLEWEYGWKPTISDIQGSIERLTGFPEAQMILRGRASESIGRVISGRNSSPTSVSTSTLAVSGKIFVEMGATATVTNPNVFLANQLGVFDLALPWKLFPFSFVVDWLTNVEQILSSVTDWYGVALSNPYTTVVHRGGSKAFDRYQTWNQAGTFFQAIETDKVKYTVRMDRTLGISGPVLSIKPFKGFSMERGAQAISLVLAVFGK